MGGSAFENFGLHTPRISPPTYRYVLQKIKSELKDKFMRVQSAIEAPEKKSYGDVDILVVPRPGAPVPSMDKIAEPLGASHWFSPSGSSIHHLAIPWPKEHNCDIQVSEDSTRTLPDSTRSTVSPRREAVGPADINSLPPPDEISSSASESESFVRPKSSSPNPISNARTSPSMSTTRHIQVDLTILPDEASLRWALFINAHGDLTSILSSMIRHKGLTINNQALYIRIADLEAENRKLARIELTRDANRVLTFLGMDADRFWRPFATLDEMMCYIATCRFYSSHSSQEDGIDTQAECTNAGDDRRLHSRPAFNYWYYTYLPTHANSPPGTQSQLSRNEVLKLTFEFFGEDIRQRYTRQKQEAETFVAKNRLWSDIRKDILAKQQDMEDAEMQQTLRALKREIIPSAAVAKTWSQSTDTSNTSSLNQYRPSGPYDQQTSEVHIAPVQLAYLNNDFGTVIQWAVDNHSVVLVRYRKMVRESGGPAFPLDHRKANPFSRTELETYSSEDDRVISIMKEKGRPWGEIMSVLGKKSKSQIQAHWKNDLDTNRTSSTQDSGIGRDEGPGGGSGG